MYIETAILGLVLGLILGGSMKKLLDLNVRGIALLIVSALVSVLPRLPVLGGRLAGFGEPAAYTVAGLRYGLLIVFALLNLRNIPVVVIGAGGALNFIATMANGGRMPVSTDAFRSFSGSASVARLTGGEILNYRLVDPSTRLLPLCDVIQVRGIYQYFLSVGDILISAGIFLLILWLMEPRRPRALFARTHAGGGEKR